MNITVSVAEGLVLSAERGDVVFFQDGNAYVVVTRTATALTVRSVHWYERLWWRVKALRRRLFL